MKCLRCDGPIDDDDVAIELDDGVELVTLCEDCAVALQIGFDLADTDDELGIELQDDEPRENGD